MGMRGGGVPKLIYGCRSLEVLGFELEIKYEFN
jgi:hypothetical protein